MLQGLYKFVVSLFVDLGDSSSRFRDHLCVRPDDVFGVGNLNLLLLLLLSLTRSAANTNIFAELASRDLGLELEGEGVFQSVSSSHVVGR